MKRYWQLSTLIPALLMAGLLADVGLRLVPLRCFTLRAWDGIGIPPGTAQPFQANIHMEKPCACSDLAMLANLKEWGAYCRRTADALQSRYGMNDVAVGFFRFFA